MSRIDKLQIQGIRSFGPDDPKKVEFYSPLTLILGQNGCGKTTIIESLKYITTGEFPPGCGKGGSFVHDPKMAGDPFVRGQIRLMFYNTKGEKMVSTRSLEVTQKAKKIECKTLDATITYYKKDGSKNSVSSKCVDFQAEMTSELGVSKPILENVIFCHQEDSNWPLDEGKKVKDKFDAIFNATKYIKCLDNIRKLRKDQKMKANSMVETLEALRTSKEQAVNFKKILEECIKEVQNRKTDKENVKEEKRQNMIEYKKIDSELSEAHDVSSRLKIKQTKLQSVNDIQDTLQARQIEQFTCSDFELEQLIDEFEQHKKDKNNKKNGLERNLTLVDKTLNQHKQDESNVTRQVGEFEAGQKVHLDNIIKRKKLLNDIVSKNNLYDTDAADVEEVLIQLTSHIQVEQQKVSTKKNTFEQTEQNAQDDIDKLKSEEAALEHDIKIHNKHLMTLNKEFYSYKKQLSNNESDLSSHSLDDLQRKMKEVVRNIELQERSFDSSSVAKEIDQHKRARQEIDTELDNLKMKIAKLNKQAKERSELEIHIGEKRISEEKVQFLERKNADAFQNLFAKLAIPNIRNELDAKLSNIQKQKNKICEKEKSFTKRKTQLDMKIANYKSDIKKKEMNLQEYDDKLIKICQGNDLDLAIDNAKKKLDNNSKMKGDCESSLVMFKGFLNKLDIGSSCPLCHRDFNDKNYAGLLHAEIEENLKDLPNKLFQLKDDLRKQEHVHGQLLQLKPQKELADKIRLEVNSLKKDLERAYVELQNVTADIEENSTNLDFISSEEDCAIRIQPNVVTMDSEIKKIQQLGDKIINLQSTLGTSDESITMDDLVEKQNDLEIKGKQIRKQIEDKQTKTVDHNTKLQLLKDERITMSTRELILKTKQQENEKLKEKVKETNENKNLAEEEMEESKQKVAPLKYEIKDKLEKKAKLVSENKNYVDRETKSIELIRDDQRTVNEVHRLIIAYVNEDKENCLKVTKVNLDSLKAKILQHEEKKHQISEDIHSIEKEISNEQQRKGDLDSEKEIRKNRNLTKGLNKEIEDLSTKVENYDFDKLNRKKNGYIKEIENQVKELARYEGQIEEITKRKESNERNLNAPGIKNAHKNFKQKFIQIKCIEVACGDLNKYYKAMDTAIMKFHREKMLNINNIIRDLWRTTYKGNDIDYIEIKTTDDDIESLGADKRRTYSYRVIMVKNAVEMDMRGRCSAGQKVLASLIIRMALAETFSSKCAILALDEPTTNLDQENIEALSMALLNIVNKRASQKNFQLIVITHDNEFLQKMTRADFIHYYHKVSRNERGQSTISRKEAISSYEL